MIRGISPDSSDILKPHTLFYDVINSPGHTIGNGHLGLVFGTKFKDESVVFGFVEAVFFLDSSLGGLN